jgi:ankyrin repeat protein
MLAHRGLFFLCTFAAKNEGGHMKIVMFLSSCGAFLMLALHAYGMENLATPLLDAAANGDIAAVENLLWNYDADIEESDAECRTPFLTTVAAGHEELADLLFRWGAYISATDWCGNTALHIAVLHGRINLIPLLLKLGFDGGEENWKGQTPLSIARAMGRADMIELMVMGPTTKDLSII